MDTQKFKGKTALLYARCSTNEKQQSTKIQIEQLKKFCIDNGITVLKEFSENISGAAEHREKLEVILYGEPMADMLIIREVSRLSREENYNDSYLKLQQLLKKYSIYVYLDDIYLEKGQTDLANDIVMLIKLFGAADERKKILDRTSTAIRKYKETSPVNVVSGKVGFGLMKAENPNFVKGVNTKNIWVKNPTEWQTVREVFGLRSKGYSILRIAAIVGLKNCIVRQIFDSKVVRYYMEQEDHELLSRSEERKESMKTVKSPSKHENIYKGIIFYEDTKRAMIHQLSARGGRYKLRDGKLTVKETIINEAVIATIRCLLGFFDLKKDELSKDNMARIEELLKMKNGYIAENSGIDGQLKVLRKKFVKAVDEEMENEINAEIMRLKAQIDGNDSKIRMADKEIKRLQAIDYKKMNLVINSNNLSEFVARYIRKVEIWEKEGFIIIIKVFVKDGYIPENWHDYKQYEVFNHRGQWIKPLPIEDSFKQVYYDGGNFENRVDTIGGGMYWELKVDALPKEWPLKK
jgi:DNA invertase Pin-like site-specific DNA recombinase